jgi:hypothetical protein
MVWLLLELATAAYLGRRWVREARNLRLLAAETAGLLDVIAGLDITSPDERARQHIAVIRQLASDF